MAQVALVLDPAGSRIGVLLTLLKMSGDEKGHAKFWKKWLPNSPIMRQLWLFAPRRPVNEVVEKSVEFIRRAQILEP
jgi:hypothetical protein